MAAMQCPPAYHKCHPCLLISSKPCRCSFLVAYAVPKFDLVLAVIAVVGDVAAPYTLPALFGLKLLPDLHRWERWLLKTLVAVSVLFALFGGYAALYTLLETLAG